MAHWAGLALTRLQAADGPPLQPGQAVAFVVELSNLTVRSAAYRATRCHSLLACCEALTAMAVGHALGDVLRLTPTDLSTVLKGLPPSKRDRPGLALRALAQAITSQFQIDLTTTRSKK